MPGKLHDNGARRCYELRDGGKLVAVAEYRLEGRTITFVHTEVPPEYEGRGYADELAGQALDDADRRGLQVMPACSFFAAYIRRHPRYAPLLAPRGSSAEEE